MGTTAKVKHPTILFDGVCNLCNSSVNFIIDRDRGAFKFASLQSAEGQRILEETGIDSAKLESIVLVENDTVYNKSTAALHIAGYLKGLWPIARLFLILPPFIRDFFYDIIAKNRYRWFGKQDTCRIPTPELRHRFLDS